MGVSQQNLVVIGEAAGPFGVRGELKIRQFTESLDVFRASEELFFGDVPYSVRAVRMHKGSVLVSLEGIDTPEKARELLGRTVKTERKNLPPTEEDEYYWFELIGMRVCRTDGRELGTITRITPTGANDVLHVEGPYGEILLPMIEEVVIEVDREKDLMLVDPLEGLVPDGW